MVSELTTGKAPETSDKAKDFIDRLHVAALGVGELKAKKQETDRLLNSAEVRYSNLKIEWTRFVLSLDTLDQTLLSQHKGPFCGK